MYYAYSFVGCVNAPLDAGRLALGMTGTLVGMTGSLDLVGIGPLTGSLTGSLAGMTGSLAGMTGSLTLDLVGIGPLTGSLDLVGIGPLTGSLVLAGPMFHFRVYSKTSIRLWIHLYQIHL